MTKLALILAIQGAALAYTLGVGRAVFSRETPNQDLQRLGASLERAASGLLARGARVVAQAAAITAAALFALRLLRGSETTARMSNVHAATLTAASVVLGAAFSLACAYLVLRTNLRASVVVARASATGLDQAVRVAVHAGGAAGLVCEALSALGLAGAFGGIFVAASGMSLPRPDALALAFEIVTALVGFPLGAALTALVLARAAGTYRAAWTLGADSLALGDASFSSEDRKDPALLSAVTGLHLVEGASRGALLFLIASTSHVAMVALGLAALTHNLGDGDSSFGGPALGLLFLPLLARAFFVFASLFALGVVRTEAFAHPSVAFARGQVCALVIGLSGLLGSAFWLTREHTFLFFTAGMLAVLALIAASLPLSTKLVRRTGFFPEPVDALQKSGASAALTSLAAGLEATLLPTLILGVGAVLVFRLGEHTGLASGGLFAGLVASGVLFGSVPFAFAVSSVNTLARAARDAASLATLATESERGGEISEGAWLAATSARAQIVAAGVATALVSALAIPVLGRAPAGTVLGLLEPSVAGCGALGVAIVLAYTGASTRAGVRASREVAAEAERQMRGVSRDQGAPRSSSGPPESEPSVDVSARSAFHRLLPYAFGVLVIEALTALALHLSYRSSQEPIALCGLSSFVLFAAVTGFAAAFTIDAARATLSFTHGNARNLVLSRQRPLSASARFSDLLGGSASPAAQVVLVAAAAAGLALAPILTN